MILLLKQFSVYKALSHFPPVRIRNIYVYLICHITHTPQLNNINYSLFLFFFVWKKSKTLFFILTYSTLMIQIITMKYIFTVTLTSFFFLILIHIICFLFLLFVSHTFQHFVKHTFILLLLLLLLPFVL